MKTWDETAGPSGDWEVQSDTRYLYDGWLLIAEYDGTQPLDTDPVVLRSHVWGLDLSVTMQGAGGVGGLLWTTLHGTGGTATYAPGYDANGNILAWVDLETAEVAGRRDYGPFGEPVKTTGIARDLPFGFSTKYEDPETGLLYYGYRYYSPGMGRWLNRDPIAEQGGLNLYGFVGNDGVNFWDYLGLVAKHSKQATATLFRLEERQFTRMEPNAAGGRLKTYTYYVQTTRTAFVDFTCRCLGSDFYEIIVDDHGWLGGRPTESGGSIGFKKISYQWGEVLNMKPVSSRPNQQVVKLTWINRSQIGFTLTFKDVSKTVSPNNNAIIDWSYVYLECP